MERFLFLVSFSFFKFKNLTTLILFFVIFWVNRFFMKCVLMGVCVDKKIVQNFGCFVIDIYDCVPTAQLGAHSVIKYYLNNYLIILTFSSFS